MCSPINIDHNDLTSPLLPKNELEFWRFLSFFFIFKNLKKNNNKYSY